jgi:hypothetical protein
MIKSKNLRGIVAAWFLVLLSFAWGVRAEISPRSKGGELLGILPAESLFCVRVNNLDQTLSTIDQFLVGVSPTPMTVSMLVRGQMAKVLGSAELNGVNMGGLSRQICSSVHLCPLQITNSLLMAILI